MEQTLPFDLQALLVFGKVAECGSLTKAAELLGMPKSTVSRQISRLERDLGIKLLRKNTRQVTVTDMGRKVFGHAASIHAEANGIRALVEDSKREPMGELRVAMPLFLGVDYASDVGAAFLRRYPGSRLDLRLVDSMVHPVKDGFDVAFGPGPLQDSTLIGRKVFSLQPFLCASAGFVRQLHRPLTAPDQLNGLHFIDCTAWGGSQRLKLAKARRRFELAPVVRARANSFQVCKQYVLQGLGVGVMPNQILCTAELQDRSMVPILPEWRLEKLDVYMMYPFQLSFSSLINAFFDTAVEIITQNSKRA